MSHTVLNRNLVLKKEKKKHNADYKTIGNLKLRYSRTFQL